MTQTGWLADFDRFAAEHARKSDPSTSHQAATGAAQFAGRHSARILACLKHHGPLTADEIAVHVGLNGHQVNKRLPDLRKSGKAIPTGQTRKSNSNHPERVWMAC